jgi:imidazole glycerol-phosphate synthase subunit HisH
MAASIAIIDSGGANIASLRFALERLGHRSELTADPARIAGAERVILPGVGAARDAMQRLAAKRLVDTVRRLEQPVLGVCLGMQLLAEASEEDDVECIGVLPGTARRLPVLPGFPVPNMGWCRIHPTASHPLLAGIEADSWFYFVHSYALPVGESTLASAQHGREFSAIAGHRNFVAAQFHPERSARAGARLLANFLEWSPCA